MSETMTVQLQLDTILLYSNVQSQLLMPPAQPPKAHPCEVPTCLIATGTTSDQSPQHEQSRAQMPRQTQTDPTSMLGPHKPGLLYRLLCRLLG
jgi:hypothetical protein